VLIGVFCLVEKSEAFYNIELKYGFCYQAIRDLVLDRDSLLIDGDSGYIQYSYTMH